MGIARLATTLVVLLALAGSAVAQASASKPAKKKASGGAGLQATIEKLEKDGWEAFKNRDRKAYTALSTPDYTAVVADGKPAHDLTGTLDVADQVTINSYKLNEVKVTSLAPNVALLTYTADVNVAFGKDQPRDIKVNVTDVWVKQGGQWKGIRYHESEVK